MPNQRRELQLMGDIPDVLSRHHRQDGTVVVRFTDGKYVLVAAAIQKDLPNAVHQARRRLEVIRALAIEEGMTNGGTIHP